MSKINKKPENNFELYREIFYIFSKGKKSFGTKELFEVMQKYEMKPSELELQVCISLIK